MTINLPSGKERGWEESLVEIKNNDSLNTGNGSKYKEGSNKR